VIGSLDTLKRTDAVIVSWSGYLRCREWTSWRAARLEESGNAYLGWLEKTRNAKRGQFRSSQRRANTSASMFLNVLSLSLHLGNISVTISSCNGVCANMNSLVHDVFRMPRDGTARLEPIPPLTNSKSSLNLSRGLVSEGSSKTGSGTRYLDAGSATGTTVTPPCRFLRLDAFTGDSVNMA